MPTPRKHFAQDQADADARWKARQAWKVRNSRYARRQQVLSALKAQTPKLTLATWKVDVVAKGIVVPKDCEACYFPRHAGPERKPLPAKPYWPDPKRNLVVVWLDDKCKAWFDRL